MTEIEHAGMGAAWLRSHPGTPIAHLDDEPCDTCDRPAPRDGTSRAASLAVAQAAEIARLRKALAHLGHATLVFAGHVGNCPAIQHPAGSECTCGCDEVRDLARAALWPDPEIKPDRRRAPQGGTDYDEWLRTRRAARAEAGAGLLHGGRCAAQHQTRLGRFVQCARKPEHSGRCRWGADNRVTPAEPFA